MRNVARRIVFSLLLAGLYFGLAAPPATADPDRGRWGGCIQACNVIREACVEAYSQDCREVYGSSADYGACIVQFLPVCNRLAFDCKYNYCIAGDPVPLRVRSQAKERSETPRAIE